MPQKPAKSHIDYLHNMIDDSEKLLSQRQATLLQWAREISQDEFTRKDAVTDLDMPLRTIEASFQRLYQLGFFDRLGQGRATRYKLVD